MHAWHVATFGVMAYVGKLKPLATYLAPLTGTPQATSITKEGLEAAMAMVGLKGRPVSDAAKQSMRFRES